MYWSEPEPVQSLELGGVTLTLYEDKSEPVLVCGKAYPSVYALAREPRAVYVRERYPCFDEFDEMHEHRYYHWYLLLDTPAQAEALRAQYARKRPLLPCLSMGDSAAALLSLPGRAVVYYEDSFDSAIVSEKA